MAARVGADLIVVGNKGVSGGKGQAIADEVRRAAPCNVLVVDTEPYWHPVTDVEARRGRIPREWQILLVTTVAVFMAFLDVTIVNVAFPSISADFPGTSLADLSWVLNAYNIVFAALLVPAGRLADRVGQRRLFFGGLWLFLAGSVLCGLAPDAVLLIAARVVQAIGAAALIPTSLALVLPEFPPERRAVATSVWAAAGAVAAAAGPSLGGVLVDAGGWRWAFLVNLVVALGVLPARRLLVDRTDAAGADPPDLFGGALLAGAVGALALGIVKAPDWGWTDDRVLGAWLARGARARRARGAEPAPPGAGAGARPAADPLVRGRQRGDARALDGLLRAVARERALPDAGLGLLGARRRLRRHARARSPRRSPRSRAGASASGSGRASCSCPPRSSPPPRACSTARSPATSRRT